MNRILAILILVSSLAKAHAEGITNISAYEAAASERLSRSTKSMMTYQFVSLALMGYTNGGTRKLNSQNADQIIRAANIYQRELNQLSANSSGEYRLSTVYRDSFNVLAAAAGSALGPKGQAFGALAQVSSNIIHEYAQGNAVASKQLEAQQYFEQALSNDNLSLYIQLSYGIADVDREAERVLDTLFSSEFGFKTKSKIEDILLLSPRLQSELENRAILKSLESLNSDFQANRISRTDFEAALKKINFEVMDILDDLKSQQQVQALADDINREHDSIGRFVELISRAAALSGANSESLQKTIALTSSSVELSRSLKLFEIARSRGIDSSAARFDAYLAGSAFLLSIVELTKDPAQTPEAVIIEMLQRLSEQIHDLHLFVNDRFNALDSRIFVGFDTVLTNLNILSRDVRQLRISVRDIAKGVNEIHSIVLEEAQLTELARRQNLDKDCFPKPFLYFFGKLSRPKVESCIDQYLEISRNRPGRKTGLLIGNLPNNFRDLSGYVRPSTDGAHGIVFPFDPIDWSFATSRIIALLQINKNKVAKTKRSSALIQLWEGAISIEEAIYSLFYKGGTVNVAKFEQLSEAYFLELERLAIEMPNVERGLQAQFGLTRSFMTGEDIRVFLALKVASGMIAPIPICPSSFPANFRLKAYTQGGATVPRNAPLAKYAELDTLRGLHRYRGQFMINDEFFSKVAAVGLWAHQTGLGTLTPCISELSFERVDWDHYAVAGASDINLRIDFYLQLNPEELESRVQAYMLRSENPALRLGDSQDWKFKYADFPPTNDPLPAIPYDLTGEYKGYYDGIIDELGMRKESILVTSLTGRMTHRYGQYGINGMPLGDFWQKIVLSEFLSGANVTDAKDDSIDLLRRLMEQSERQAKRDIEEQYQSNDSYRRALDIYRQIYVSLRLTFEHGDPILDSLLNSEKSLIDPSSWVEELIRGGTAGTVAAVSDLEKRMKGIEETLKDACLNQNERYCGRSYYPPSLDLIAPQMQVLAIEIHKAGLTEKTALEK